MKSSFIGNIKKDIVDFKENVPTLPQRRFAAKLRKERRNWKMFVDRVKIHVKGGDSSDGKVPLQSKIYYARQPRWRATAAKNGGNVVLSAKAA